jgi:hypothetical protein
MAHPANLTLDGAFTDLALALKNAVQPDRFNGATFIQTWKRAESVRLAGKMSLQWSHVYSNVETFRTRPDRAL